MNKHSIAASLVGAALLSGTLAAQDTTRKVKSEQRVQISKGEVTLPKIDTVFVTRRDTVYVRWTDTVRTTRYVPQTFVRVDTMMVPVERKIVRNLLYVGLYTGMTAPVSEADVLYTNGVHVGGMIGWDGLNQFLGVRGKAEFAELGRQYTSAATLLTNTAPMLGSLGVDLKVMPLNLNGWRLYGIGGISANTYKGLATIASAGEGVSDPATGGWYTPASSGWSTLFGFNAGGGADVQLGRHDMFIEARAVALQSKGAQTWTVPISLGLRFF